MSKNFTIKSISNQSLDVITETGWYSGNNIKELASYKLSWCMIHAMVQSDNAATIYVSGDNGQQLIVVKRNTDGTYAFTPYATKSDLTQYITVEKTTDAYGQISLDKAYNIKSLFCMGDRRFASLVGDINVRITDSTGDAIKNTPVKVIVGYKS